MTSPAPVVNDLELACVVTEVAIQFTCRGGQAEQAGGGGGMSHTAGATCAVCVQLKLGWSDSQSAMEPSFCST